MAPTLLLLAALEADITWTNADLQSITVKLLKKNKKNSEMLRNSFENIVFKQ